MFAFNCTCHACVNTTLKFFVTHLLKLFLVEHSFLVVMQPLLTIRPSQNGRHFISTLLISICNRFILPTEISILSDAPSPRKWWCLGGPPSSVIVDKAWYCFSVTPRPVFDYVGVPGRQRVKYCGLLLREPVPPETGFYERVWRKRLAIKNEPAILLH